MSRRRLRCAIPLPRRFRPDDILAFHRRDPQEVAERAGMGVLEKGILWHGVPSRLTFRFQPGKVDAELAVDGDAGSSDEAPLERLTRRMLGLDQDIDGFERKFSRHPQVAPLIKRNRGLRVPVAATPFEALTWAVTGQQVSVKAAVAVRRKLIVAAGARHSSGLYCYPDAGRVAALGEEKLRLAGYSGAKAATLLAVARQVMDRSLPLDDWLAGLPADQARERLLAVRGIGPWTVDYTLLRGFGWLDGSLHGDVAVRRGLQGLLDMPGKVGEAQARAWLSAFSPWRALVAAHLWAARSSAGE
ncbi:MAG: DNA-3-methyladenine glycosylase 2 [Rhodocyclaceae bacterium]|nr:DNA-3-methyladenine glycosylase 2 [Rhodocyclaceae bacterium]